MKAIIRALYHEKLDLSNRRPKEKRYVEKSDEICNELNRWKDKLSEDDFYDLESKLLVLISDRNNIELEENFSLGFKTGARFMMEVLDEENFWIDS